MNTEEFTRAAESQWKELVVHSLIVTEDKIDMMAAALAMSSKTSKENIKHKILAIRWAVGTQVKRANHRSWPEQDSLGLPQSET